MLVGTGTEIPDPGGEDKTLHPGGVPRHRSDLVDGVNEAEGESGGDHVLVLPTRVGGAVGRNGVQVPAGRGPPRRVLVLPLELVEIGAEGVQDVWTNQVSTAVLYEYNSTSCRTRCELLP
jgi:hypothetical protein